jgi:Leucine-rich repeat (LRR) protein
VQGVHRISLIKNDIFTMEKPIPCTGLRTLLLCNNFNLQSISESFFDNLRYLSVLYLSQTSIRSVPKSIWNLRRLKFLNLSETNIEMLPKSLCGLKRLQFLDISGCQHLRSLHMGIGRHKFMLHLNLKGCKNLK